MDPLAQFRRKNQAPPTSPSFASPSIAAMQMEEDVYIAYDGKDRIERLRIRRANGITRAPTYHALMDIVYDMQATCIILVYQFLMVTIKGKNLHGLISALENHTADYVQEFDSRRWKKHLEKSASFIESIEVKVKPSVEAITESEKNFG